MQNCTACRRHFDRICAWCPPLSPGLRTSLILSFSSRLPANGAYRTLVIRMRVVTGSTVRAGGDSRKVQFLFVSWNLNWIGLITTLSCTFPRILPRWFSRVRLRSPVPSLHNRYSICLITRPRPRRERWSTWICCSHSRRLVIVAVGGIFSKTGRLSNFFYKSMLIP